MCYKEQAVWCQDHPDYAQEFGTCGTYSIPDVSLVPNSTDAAAFGMWATLQGFMGVFPQYSKKQFSLSTESYGGHYIPSFAEYIEIQNAKNIPGAHKIEIQSVLIGNGWLDPIIQYQAYYNFSVSPGNTYDVLFNATNAELQYNNLYGSGKCLDQLKQCATSGDDDICSSADNFCAQNVEEIYDNTSGRDEFDVRELEPDPFPYGFFADYINTPKVQSAIGAFQNWTAYSNAVGEAFESTGDDSREEHTIEDLSALLKQNVSVTMYYGDADYSCNWIGGEAVAAKVDAPGFEDAGYVDITSADGIVHGQVKQSGTFSFVRFFYSGHEVSFYQPLASLELLYRAINGKDVATGNKDVFALGSAYKTVGTAKSEFREGNATVQYQALPQNAKYNYTIHGPDPWKRDTTVLMREVKRHEFKRRRLHGQKGRSFRPIGR